MPAPSPSSRLCTVVAGSTIATSSTALSRRIRPVPKRVPDIRPQPLTHNRTACAVISSLAPGSSMLYVQTFSLSIWGRGNCYRGEPDGTGSVASTPCRVYTFVEDPLFDLGVMSAQFEIRLGSRPRGGPAMVK